MLATLNPIQQGVWRTMVLPLAFQKYLEAKRRIMETQNISPCKNMILKKTLYNKPKILQDMIIINSILTNNLKFQHKPKISSSFKNPHIKMDLLHRFK